LNVTLRTVFRLPFGTWF